MRGELGDRAACSAQLSIVSSFVATVAEADLVRRAVEMALSLEHAIYDCVYLALAERLADTLITADEKFWSNVAGSAYKEHARLLI